MSEHPAVLDGVQLGDVSLLFPPLIDDHGASLFVREEPGELTYSRRRIGALELVPITSEALGSYL